jgi:hypothetical protein
MASITWCEIAGHVSPVHDHASLHLYLENLDDVFKNRNFYFDGGRRCLRWKISVEMIRFAQYERSVVHDVIDHVVYIDAKKVMLYVFLRKPFCKRNSNVSSGSLRHRIFLIDLPFARPVDVVDKKENFLLPTKRGR